MNLEDFQAQFDEMWRKHRHDNMYGNLYVFRDEDMEEMYNLCLKAMNEL